eukprot:933546-Alexandrium_andersonii.AAC.1
MFLWAGNVAVVVRPIALECGSSCHFRIAFESFCSDPRAVANVRICDSGHFGPYLVGLCYRP